MLKPSPKPKNRKLTPSRHPNEDNAIDSMNVKLDHPVFREFVQIQGGNNF
jgi:hypothetical protein